MEAQVPEPEVRSETPATANAVSLSLDKAIAEYLSETALHKSAKTLSAYTLTLILFRQSCGKQHLDAIALDEQRNPTGPSANTVKMPHSVVEARERSDHPAIEAAPAAQVACERWHEGWPQRNVTLLRGMDIEKEDLIRACASKPSIVLCTCAWLNRCSSLGASQPIKLEFGYGY